MVANINMEKWVIYLAIFVFILYLGNTGSLSAPRGYATFTDDSVDVAQSSLMDDGVPVSSPLSDVLDDSGTGYSGSGSYPSPPQQQIMQIPSPRLFYPTRNTYISFELAAPQEPSGRWPSGIEWGAEYFVFAHDSSRSPDPLFVFGLGDAYSNRWSGLRRILPSSFVYNNKGLAAFGNRIAYEYFLYPDEAVLGREAGIDGLVGTGDDRIVPVAIFANGAVYTLVDLVRNAALYVGAVAGTPLIYHSFGNDLLAGTADDRGDVVTTSFIGPFGTSNSKISYYRMLDFVTITLAGPGLNGVFEGNTGGGGGGSLLFGGG